MNTEIIKAMNAAENKKAPWRDGMSKWWDENKVAIKRIVFFPLWLGLEAHDAINQRLNARQEWSEDRANAILNYYIPRASEFITEDGQKYFYFFDNGLGWLAKSSLKKLNRKDRRFWRVNYWRIRSYLIESFQLEDFSKEIGFTKEVGNCWEGWTEIYFTLNNNQA